MTAEIESAVEVTLDLDDDYRFSVDFGLSEETNLVMDEPPPLGQCAGPNAARMLAAAVGNCLSASLLFCLRKARVEVNGLHTTARAGLVRNERGRVRVGSIDVTITLDLVGDTARVGRCLDIFQDYCVVSDAIRTGLPVTVDVKNR